MLLYYHKSNLSPLTPSLTPSAAASHTDTYIEDLCIGKLLVALVPAADKRSGRVHRVDKRRRNLSAGRSAAAIVAGAGIGGCAGAAIGAGG